MDVSTRAGVGGVHVAVGIDPQESNPLALVTGACGRGYHRTGGQAVIAAQHHGDRFITLRRERRVENVPADVGDIFDVLLRGITRTACFPYGRRQVSPVSQLTAKLRIHTTYTGDAHGGWPHVDAAASRAQVEGHPDDVDGIHRWVFLAEIGLEFLTKRTRHQ